MNLWIPDQAGRDAIGELPEDVSLGLIPRDGEPPEEILDAEFLVPSSGDSPCSSCSRGCRGCACCRRCRRASTGCCRIVPPGVTVCDAGGARDTAVAEWVLAAILASTRRLPELRDRQREHRWESRESSELAGSTVMILGYGAIGAAVEARLAPFDVELIRVARHARPGVHSVDDLSSLLPRAEIVVVLLPLTPETERAARRRCCSACYARARCSSTPRAGRSSTPMRCSSCCRRDASARRST